MSKPTDVLRIAAGEIGYSRWNDPERGTKYGRWYSSLVNDSYFGANGVPFCAMFVSWVLAKAGVKCEGFPAASCGVALRAATKAGAVIADKRQAKPGDIVIFDWPTVAGGNDHTGIVELNRGGYIQTIEGNTSPGSAGSQGNGGGVYRRTRDWSVVQAVIRPAYDGEPAPKPVPKPHDDKIAVDGFWGEDTTSKAQQLAEKVADGEVWHQYPGNKGRLKGCTSGWQYDKTLKGSPIVRYLQEHVLGIKADGIAGKDFANAMIRKYGNGYQDGKLDGPSTAIAGLQRSLNNGKF